MSFGNIYKGKKVLITGHTGFKGSWMALWLKHLGADVFGYSLPATSEKDNFVTCGLESQIEQRIGDIRDKGNLLDFFTYVQPDFAFHLAAQPLVLLSYQDPVGTFDVNLMGTVNFLEAVRATKSVKAAVNVTTDKCYENREWVWGYRENDPMGGKDPYSASKGCSELITSSYIHSFFSTDNTCNVGSGRAGNVIGGGDWAADRIIPDFFRAYESKETLTVRNPQATRPWQHVLEPLSGYLELGHQLYNGGMKFSGGWNFGPEDGKNYSVGVLIDLLIENLGGGSYDYPQGLDQLHEANLLKLDISKAINVLNWRPTLSFSETVKFTLDGYKSDMESRTVGVDRIGQIDAFTNIANQRGIKWAK
jgi:CDP-glucose 4,6-dehydratase